MNKIAILGATAVELDAMRMLLEKSLAMQLAPHESDSCGGEHFRSTYEGCTFLLQRNFFDEYGEKAERKHPDADVLLYLTGELLSVDKMLSRIANISGAPVPLSTRTYEPKARKAI